MQQPSQTPLVPALDAVKRSGRCNMFDRYCVQRAMRDLGFMAQANFLEANSDIYIDILIQEYSRWMEENQPESLVEKVARETGLEIIQE